MGRTPAESRVHGDNTVNTAPNVYSPEGDEADTCMGGAVSGVLVGSSHSSRSMAVDPSSPLVLHSCTSIFAISCKIKPAEFVSCLH
jgi:hypothetical protein